MNGISIANQYDPATCNRNPDLCRVAVVDVAIAGHFDDVPRARFPIIGKIDMLFVQIKVERYLVSVKGPRAEFQQARLLIEREICHVDRAGTL